jgi:hypothetical protein
LRGTGTWQRHENNRQARWTAGAGLRVKRAKLAREISRPPLAMHAIAGCQFDLILSIVRHYGMSSLLLPATCDAKGLAPKAVTEE